MLAKNAGRASEREREAEKWRVQVRKRATPAAGIKNKIKRN